MRVTVFTSNQPRHVALLEQLMEVASEVFAVVETATLFPGRVGDLHRGSEVMARYFDRVRAAEAAQFGAARPAPAGVRVLPLRLGDASQVPPGWLREALDADAIIVFGASYLRGALCEELVRRHAVNLHMGVSPQYRGSSTNFWALYDRRPELVGATIHRLTAGLDSGPILFHALPPAEDCSAFALGMRAVAAGQAALVESLRTGELNELTSVPQDRAAQLRYSRGVDFTDAVAAEFLERVPSPQQIGAALRSRDPEQFVRARVEQFVRV